MYTESDMTAIEWYFKQMQSKKHFTKDEFDSIYEQAKEIEKQQIIDARVNGVCEGIDIGARPIGQPITEDISKNHEIYYNETFKKQPRLQG
jgi:urate oxidase